MKHNNRFGDPFTLDEPVDRLTGDILEHHPKKPFMRKSIYLFAFMAILSFTIGSCTTMKKDCQGNRHVKLKNGIYI